jgi:hypothetical protein
MTSSELQESNYSFPKSLIGQIAVPKIAGISHRARKSPLWKVVFRLVCCAIDTMWLRGPGMAIVTFWWSSIRRNPIVRRYLRQRYNATRLAARLQLQSGKAVRDVP